MDAGPWIARFAGELGLDPPDDATVDELLRLAGVAAHSSERIAAPIACYLIGRAGVDLRTASELVERVAAGPSEGPPGSANAE